MEGQVNKGIVGRIQRREIGVLDPTSFRRRVSLTYVDRLQHEKSLYDWMQVGDYKSSHNRRVWTLKFNSSGTILACGCVDGYIVLWEWERQHKQVDFRSGHKARVEQVLFMTDERKMISTSIGKKVQLADISEADVMVTELDSEVNSRVAVGSSQIFYAAYGNGSVYHHDLRRSAPTKLLTCGSLFIMQNNLDIQTIVTSPTDSNHLLVGGYDQYVRLYDLRMVRSSASNDRDWPAEIFCPPYQIENRYLSVAGLSCSTQEELLASYAPGNIYLFEKPMSLGTVLFSDPNEIVRRPKEFQGHLHSAPFNNGIAAKFLCDDYIVCGSECHRIYVYAKKDGHLLRMLNADGSRLSCIETHPIDPCLASGDMTNGRVKIWLPTAQQGANLPEDWQNILDENDDSRKFSFEWQKSRYNNPPRMEDCPRG